VLTSAGANTIQRPSTGDLASASSPIANSQVLQNTTFGVLELSLHATSYDWRFVPEAGKTFTYVGSTACH
jgi:hypothetical protein